MVLLLSLSTVQSSRRFVKCPVSVCLFACVHACIYDFGLSSFWPPSFLDTKWHCFRWACHWAPKCTQVDTYLFSSTYSFGSIFSRLNAEASYGIFCVFSASFFYFFLHGFFSNSLLLLAWKLHPATDPIAISWVGGLTRCIALTYYVHATE